MKLERVTPPTATPVSIDDLLDHLWTVYDNTKDAYLQKLLTGATNHVETVTGRKLVSQVWRGYLQAWPLSGEPIMLPYGRIVSVDEFNWLDVDGNDHTLTASTDYLPAVIGPEPQVIPITSWPSEALFIVDPIRIKFTAGFGTPAEVPDDLRHAISMLAAHWYENRESTITGTMISKVPMAFDSLVSPWRMRHV
jgi:uncharacterized phiE125 gp8 family phage protein